MTERKRIEEQDKVRYTIFLNQILRSSFVKNDFHNAPYFKTEQDSEHLDYINERIAEAQSQLCDLNDEEPLVVASDMSKAGFFLQKINAKHV